MLDVIILAGAEKSFDLLNNKTLLEYVVDAFIQVNIIDKIVVVGPIDKCGYIKDKVYEIVNCKDSLFENVKQGLASLQLDKPFVLSSSDIPFITKEAIEDFVNESLIKKAEFSYPLISKELILKRYPDMKRSFFKLKEGAFTGGNLCFIKPSIVNILLPYLENIYKFRKQKLQLVKLFSTIFVLGIFLGILPLKMIERKFYKITGIKGYGIITNYLEIAFDIDKKEDWILAERVEEDK